MHAKPVHPTVVKLAATDPAVQRAAEAKQWSVLRADIIGGGQADVYVLSESATRAMVAAAGRPVAASFGPLPEEGPLRRSRALLASNIIGADNRVDIDMAAHVMPLRAVGYVDLGDRYCSGALVGPQTVLTAAHCLYSVAYNKWSYPVFWPNLHGGNRAHCHAGSHAQRCYTPRKVYPASMVIMGRRRTNCGEGCVWSTDIPYDIGVVILKEAISTYGSFALAYDCTGTGVKKYSVATAGYPGDKTSGYLYTSIHPWGWPTVTITMCPTGARVAVTSQLDTAGGQSGSPVYSTDGRVRAVHSAVGGGKSYHAPIDYTAYTFIKKYRK